MDFDVGIYGAGALGRYIAARLSHPFVFVDDTPEKQGTQIDGAEVWSLPEFARHCKKREPAPKLYSCIMQGDYHYNYFDRYNTVRAEYGVELLPFPPLLLSLDGVWHFYEKRETLQTKKKRYLQLQERLADELSVRTLKGHVILRETGDLTALVIVPPTFEEHRFFTAQMPDNINYVDVGAYDGDSLESFVVASDGRFARLWAVEPDAENRQRLEARMNRLLGKQASEKLTVIAEGITANGGEQQFHATGGMSSHITSAGGRDKNADNGYFMACSNGAAGVSELIKTRRLDELDVPLPAAYKMDLEGADFDVLESSLSLVARTRPFLELSVYHYPDDLLDMFDLVEGLHAGYRYYLRNYSSDGFDLRLYCIPE